MPKMFVGAGGAANSIPDANSRSRILPSILTTRVNAALPFSLKVNSDGVHLRFFTTSGCSAISFRKLEYEISSVSDFKKVIYFFKPKKAPKAKPNRNQKRGCFKTSTKFLKMLTLLFRFPLLFKNARRLLLLPLLLVDGGPKTSRITLMNAFCIRKGDWRIKTMDSANSLLMFATGPGLIGGLLDDFLEGSTIVEVDEVEPILK